MKTKEELLKKLFIYASKGNEFAVLMHLGRLINDYGMTIEEWEQIAKEKLDDSGD